MVQPQDFDYEKYLKIVEERNVSSIDVQASDNENENESSSSSSSSSPSSSESGENNEDADIADIAADGLVSDEEDADQAKAEAGSEAAEAVKPAEAAKEKAQAEAEKKAKDKAKAEKLAGDKARDKAEKLADDKAKIKAEKLAARQVAKEIYDANLKKLVSVRHKKIYKLVKNRVQDVHPDTKTNRSTVGFFPRVDMHKAIHSLVKLLESRQFKDLTAEDLMPHIQCLVNPSTRNEEFTRHIAVALFTLKRAEQMFAHPTLVPLVLIFMPQIILLLGNADAEHKVAHWTNKAPHTLPLGPAQSCNWFMRDFCESHSQVEQRSILCQRILEKMKTEGLLPEMETEGPLPEMKTATKKRDRDADSQPDTVTKKVKTAEEDTK